LTEKFTIEIDALKKNFNEIQNKLNAEIAYIKTEHNDQIIIYKKEIEK